MASTRGPVPKRSSERRRRNKASKAQIVPAIGKVDRPRVAAHWHPIAKSWFTSLEASGQSKFFEPSDWQAARYVAEVMTRHLKSPKPSAQLFTGIWAAMTDLLTTEGARRRVRMEIERGDQVSAPPGVTALDEYRAQLGA